MKSYQNNEQLNLFSDFVIDDAKEAQNINSGASNTKILPVSFRDLVPNIKDTGYLTFCILLSC